MRAINDSATELCIAHDLLVYARLMRRRHCTRPTNGNWIDNNSDRRPATGNKTRNRYPRSPGTIYFKWKFNHKMFKEKNNNKKHNFTFDEACALLVGDLFIFHAILWCRCRRRRRRCRCMGYLLVRISIIMALVLRALADIHTDVVYVVKLETAAHNIHIKINTISNRTYYTRSLNQRLNSPVSINYTIFWTNIHISRWPVNFFEYMFD